MKKILIILIFLTYTKLAFSKDQFASWGFIALDCNQIQNTKQRFGEEFILALLSSVQGYMTGLNAAKIKNKGKNAILKNLNYHSFEALERYLMNYCDDLPNSNITKAADNYYKELPNLSE